MSSVPKKQKKHIYIGVQSLTDGGAEKNAVNAFKIISSLGYSCSIIIFKDMVSSNNRDIPRTCINSGNLLSVILSLSKVIQSDSILLAFDHRITLYFNVLRLFKQRIVVGSRIVNNMSLLLKSKNRLIKLVEQISSGLVQFKIFQCQEMCSDHPKSKFTRICKTIYNPIEKRDVDFTSEKDIDFLYVGRLAEQKNLKLLFDSFQHLQKTVSDINLYVVGGGKDLPQWQRYVDSNNIQNVAFTGKVTNVPDYYLRSRTVVLTSYFEGFPNVLLEALSFGVPVVSVDCQYGPKEIIENGSNGLLVKSDSVQDFSSAMYESYNRVWSVEEILKSTSKFSFDSCVNEYQKLFEEINVLFG